MLSLADPSFPLLSVLDLVFFFGNVKENTGFVRAVAMLFHKAFSAKVTSFKSG